MPNDKYICSDVLTTVLIPVDLFSGVFILFVKSYREDTFNYLLVHIAKQKTTYCSYWASGNFSVLEFVVKGMVAFPLLDALSIRICSGRSAGYTYLFFSLKSTPCYLLQGIYYPDLCYAYLFLLCMIMCMNSI